MTKKFITIITIFALLVIIAISSVIYNFYWANDKSVIKHINTINQNALTYVKKESKPVITKKKQSELVHHYLNNYFSPWDSQQVKNPINRVRKLEANVANEFTKNPGYGENKQLHDQAWINKIVNNMNLQEIPNINTKAIVIKDTDVRLLPTVDPSFHYWKKAGEGYPFDYLQVTRIHVNTPILVLNITKDGQWYLIKTLGFLGWIQNDSVAFVKYPLIKLWKTHTYIVAKHDDYSALDDNFRVKLKTHIGVLYPLLKTTKNHYKVLIATAGNGYAKVKTVNLRKDISTNFPIPITAKNIAAMANNMMGRPYGWGDMHGYRDCSGTTMDLFANFGIWLPRNSGDQIEVGRQISLANLTNAKKESLIIKSGIPFMTLIHEPGHILVYIGHKNNQIYVLHNKWGLKTKNLFRKEGRAMIGKTVITPLSLGKHYINVPKSILDDIDKMTILIN